MEAIDNYNPVETGKIGGLTGGKIRSERLTPERRKLIASNAARARWRRTPKGSRLKVGKMLAESRKKAP